MRTTPPDWDHCGIDATEEDPLGCRGVRTARDAPCLAHLEPGARAAHLAARAPGDGIDCRGVTFDAALLTAVLEVAVSDDGCGVCDFTAARFTDDVLLSGARFGGDMVFGDARFEGLVDLDTVRFERGAWFHGARFLRQASFGGTRFGADAGFGDAVFHERAWFGAARFEGKVWFDRTHFHGDAVFLSAHFTATSMASVICSGTLSLADATFSRPLRLTAAARHIDASGARFEGPVTLRARYATIDLTGALLTHPCAVATDHAAPARPAEAALAAEREITVAVVSVQATDAAMLLLADTNLSRCVFSGAHHLDQLRLEGRWDLGTVPSGVRWHRGIPRWWSTRQVIVEEARWRALPRRPAAARLGWPAPPDDPGATPGLATLTTLYRQLRKAREDAKDEPGAADLYYGEMEMRRHSHRWHRPERWLLQAYWLLSGYGLRAARSLGWLVCAMAVTTVLMTGFGLPDTAARPYPSGSGLIGKGHPELRRPFGERFTADRVDKAVDVVLNSVVFRSSGTELTRAGGYLEKASRLGEPVLFGLTVLAVRGRVKRG
ncbi:pentapeptide repeat-containing protein [Streptomyces sp. S465]|uniref:pentapeptide repeat-containing protein n=1 Tax=Streptomyces sp. S465 TaxID=2979468 RepID=UPI0022A82BEB|nr:pentapeptide repeat-containing protein [Streptomyces sp. S465]WAP59888.1 pentapeptide repeat-containing protein [Streptomyces sp. S465]